MKRTKDCNILTEELSCWPNYWRYSDDNDMGRKTKQNKACKVKKEDHKSMYLVQSN